MTVVSAPALTDTVWQGGAIVADAQPKHTA
jgi:hypothetical protein